MRGCFYPNEGCEEAEDGDRGRSSRGSGVIHDDFCTDEMEVGDSPEQAHLQSPEANELLSSRIDNFTDRRGPVRITSRAQRTRQEKTLKTTQRLIKTLKRKRTLERASRPRTKHDRHAAGVMSRRMRRPLNVAHPPVRETHDALVETLEGAQLVTYLDNYHSFLVRQGRAIEAADMKDQELQGQTEHRERLAEQFELWSRHRNLFQPSLRAIATAVPHEDRRQVIVFGTPLARSADRVQAAKGGLSQFFPVKTGHYRRQAEREWKRMYYDKVRLALDYKITEWPETLEEKAHRVAKRKHRNLQRNEMRCSDCKLGLVVNTRDAHLTCPGCGIVVPGWEGVQYHVSFAQQQATQRGPAPYDRLAHFKEFIARLEGSERTVIPQIVINSLLKLCQQHRIDPIKDHEKVTYYRVREFLARAGYAHFFENIPLIMSFLTHRPPLRFTPLQREKLTYIFKEIQEPFERHKGRRRKNFLSYAYTTYKSCELLGLREFLPLLPLLKPSNLLHADEIWEKICEECNYQFIPTV